MLIGRSGEFEKLTALLEQVRGRLSGAVVLRGEGGDRKDDVPECGCRVGRRPAHRTARRHRIGDAAPLDRSGEPPGPLTLVGLAPRGPVWGARSRQPPLLGHA
jgi:hypothetical protein